MSDLDNIYRMQPTGQFRHAIWQRTLYSAITIVLLLAGSLQALHHHEAEGADESHCHDWGTAATTHLETLEPAHPEPCGLCAKTLSSSSLERPRAALVEELVAENLPERRLILPPGPPGRHGASRAPPLAGSEPG